MDGPLFEFIHLDLILHLCKCVCVVCVRTLVCVSPSMLQKSQLCQLYILNAFLVWVTILGFFFTLRKPRQLSQKQGSSFDYM